MKLFHFMFISFTVFLLMNSAQAKQGETYYSAFLENLKPPVTYDELCKYDKFCDRLKNASGEFETPKKMSMIIFQSFRAMVVEIAKKYEVDPVLLIAVIATEHTLNVNIDDVWQNMLIKSNTLGGNPLDFSYGFGQIHDGIALEVEPIVAKVEKREVYADYQSIRDRLFTMEGALNYAAAILVDARQKYADQGIDISNSPGVMASLYNLGNVERRAQAAKGKESAPQVNFFGWFVLYNWSIFYKAIVEPPKSMAFSNEMLEESKLSGMIGDPVYPLFSTSSSLPLFLRPERCAFGYNYDNKSKTIAMESIARSETDIGGFEILSQSYDCNGNEWSLLKMFNGAVGWVSHLELQKSVTIDYFSRRCENDNERQSKAQACAAEIVKLDKRIQIIKQSNDSMEIKLVGYDKNSPLTVVDYDERCADPKYRADLKSYNEQMKSEKIKYEAEVAAAEKYEAERKLQQGKADETSQPEILNDPRIARFQRDVEAFERDVVSRRKRLQQTLAEYKTKFGVDLISPTQDDLNEIKSLIEAKQAEFLKFVGVSYADAQRVYPDVLRRINVFGDYSGSYLDSYCVPRLIDNRTVSDCYIAPIAVIKAELDSLDFIKLLNEVPSYKDSYGVVDKFTVVNGLVDSELDFANFKKKIEVLKQSKSEIDEKINKVCSPLFDKFPSVKESYKALVKKMDTENSKLPYEYIKVDGELYYNIELHCSVYSQYLLFSSARDVNVPLVIQLTGLSATYNSSPQVYMISDKSSGNKNQYYDKLFVPRLSYMSIEDKTIERSLNYVFQDVANYNIDSQRRDAAYDIQRPVKNSQANQKYGYYLRSFNLLDESKCNYDPTGSSEVINKISKLDCASMIEIPDEKTLIRRIGVINKKAVGVVTGEETFQTSFRINMKPSCTYWK